MNENKNVITVDKPTRHRFKFDLSNFLSIASKGRVGDRVRLSTYILYCNSNRMKTISEKYSDPLSAEIQTSMFKL